MADTTNTPPNSNNQTVAPKQLYRSETNKMLAGVCGGIAEYFNADPTLVRVGAVVLILITGGAGILAYIIGAIVIPVKPATTSDTPAAASTAETAAPIDKK